MRAPAPTAAGDAWHFRRPTWNAGPLLACIVLLVAAVVPAAFALPNAQPDKRALEGVILDLVGSPNGYVAVAANDPGSTVKGNGSVPTWAILDVAGTVVQSGPADAASCMTRVGDMCSSPSVAAAISADGSRVAIVSQVTASPLPTDTVRGTLVLATSGQGEFARLTLDFNPVAVAMDASGHTVAVAGVRTPFASSTSTAVLRMFDWGTNAKPFANATGDLPVVAVAIDPAGTVAVMAAADGVRLGRDGTVTVLATSGDVTAVAASRLGSDDALFLLGTSTGRVTAYNATATPALTSLPLSNGAVTGLALAADGHVAYAGDAQGNVWRITEPATAPHPALATLGSPVTRLAATQDGAYVAVTAGTKVAQFHDATLPPRLARQWLDERGAGNATPGVAITADGDRVVAARGPNVRAYAATHELTLSVPPVAPVRNGTVQFTVNVTNTGNRPVAVPFQVTAPSGWDTTVSATEVKAEPGGSTLVNVTSLLPGDPSPQQYIFTSTTPLRTLNIPVDVPRVTDLRLVTTQATSLGIRPGEATAFLATLENHGNAREQTRLEASPDRQGWSASVSPPSTDLRPGRSAELEINVVAPPSAVQGDHATITVTAGGTSAPLLLTATVGATFDPRLESPPSTMVHPGAVTRVPLSLLNGGNAPDTLTLGLTSAVPPGWNVTFDGHATFEARDLAPGASATPALAITVPANAPPGATTSVTFGLRSAAEPGRFVSRTMTLTVAGTPTSTPAASSSKSPGPAAPILMVGLAVVAFAVSRRRN